MLYNGFRTIKIVEVDIICDAIRNIFKIIKAYKYKLELQ